MKNLMNRRSVTILVTAITTLIILISFMIVEWVLYDYFIHTIFVNIFAETAPMTDQADTTHVKADESEGAGTPEGAEEKQQDTNPNDSADQKNTESSKDAVRKRKVEKIINDLPHKLSADSTIWRRFPVDLTNFKVGDFQILNRREGETDVAYKLRLARFFSAVCTARAAGTLENNDWKIFIENMRLCSNAQVMSYELRSLELAEQDALENEEYDKFLATVDSELLNIRRGRSKPQQNWDLWDEESRLRVAHRNYVILSRMMCFETMQKPEYSFLKSMWEHTIIDKSKPEGSPSSLPATYTEFYLHLNLPQELLNELAEKTHMDPAVPRTTENVGNWLFYLLEVKKDPHFFEEFRRSHK